MNLQQHLAAIARDLREGIPTDAPRQRMDYAARQLEQLAAIPIPEIARVADLGGLLVGLHLKSPPNITQLKGLQVFLTGELT